VAPPLVGPWLVFVAAVGRPPTLALVWPQVQEQAWSLVQKLVLWADAWEPQVAG